MPFVSSKNGWNFSVMTAWSYAVTLRGTSTVVDGGAAGSARGGGSGAEGGGPGAGVATVGGARSIEMVGDVDEVLLAWSSARSSRREVAASSLRAQFDHEAPWEMGRYSPFHDGRQRMESTL